MPVKAGEDVVVLGAEFDAGHVPDSHRGSVGAGADDDIAELFRVFQPTFGDNDGIELLAGSGRRLTHFAGGQLNVLGAQGGGDIARRQVVGVEPVRLQPNAHGILGAEQDGLADALDAPDLVENVGGGETAQGHIIEALVRRIEHGEQQVVALRLGDGNAQPADILGQTGFDAFVAVLGLDG